MPRAVRGSGEDDVFTGWRGLYCRLYDDGGAEVHAIEGGKDPQALLVRVGPVFYEDEEEARETGVWIGYQDHYRRSDLAGPVLLTPEVWRQLNQAVERRLRRRRRGRWHRHRRRIRRQEIRTARDE